MDCKNLPQTTPEEVAVILGCMQSQADHKLFAFGLCMTTLLVKQLVSRKTKTLTTNTSNHLFSISFCLVNFSTKFGVFEILAEVFLFGALSIKNESFTSLLGNYEATINRF